MTFEENLHYDLNPAQFKTTAVSWKTLIAAAPNTNVCCVSRRNSHFIYSGYFVLFGAKIWTKLTFLVGKLNLKSSNIAYIKILEYPDRL